MGGAERDDWDAAVLAMQHAVAAHLAGCDARDLGQPPPSAAGRAPATSVVADDWGERLGGAKRQADEVEVWLREQERQWERWERALALWRGTLEQTPAPAAGGTEHGDESGGDPPGGG